MHHVEEDRSSSASTKVFRPFSKSLVLFSMVHLLSRCYMQAIRLKPRSSLYWSCLAQAVYLQARYQSDDQLLLKQALDYMKVALSLKPKDPLLWNALGVIAAHPSERDREKSQCSSHGYVSGMKEAALAQHCFFKSLQLQRSAIAYTNLGFLYYRYDNLQTANKAFSSAQQTDPMYPLAWLGQVLRTSSVKCARSSRIDFALLL